MTYPSTKSKLLLHFDVRELANNLFKRRLTSLISFLIKSVKVLFTDLRFSKTILD